MTDKYKSKKIKLYNYEVWAFSKSAEDNYKIYYEKDCNTKKEALRYCRKFMLKIKKEVLSNHNDVWIEATINKFNSNEWIQYNYHGYYKKRDLS